jgi:flagellar FliJ protein
MKKFQFSLEKLLKLREFEEHNAEIELGKAVSELEKLNAELEDCGKKRIQANKERSGLSVTELLVIDNYITKLDILSEQLMQEIAQAQITVEQKRTIYVEKLKNRKSISKLEEKQYQVWKKESAKQEEKSVEDNIAARYVKTL